MSADLGEVRREDSILSLGLAAFQRLLPAGWKADRAQAGQDDQSPASADAVVLLQDPQGMGGRLIVEAKRYFTPRDAEQVLGGQLRLIRQLDASTAVLVVAPWLSSRTQELLEQQDVNYLDLTGNARVIVERPAVLIRTVGAERDPDPPDRRAVTLKGPKAGRVVRMLADVAPPYTATALSEKAGVSLPYVSRLLSELEREALVERSHRSLVVAVDWPNLLRRRAETYSLFATNRTATYLAPTGPTEAVKRLREEAIAYRAITGSFAAVQVAPVAAPAQLMVYVDDPEPVADALGLLPADRGADVVLLEPYDFVVNDRQRQVDGLTAVALSQLALDCLAGNGRMPAEGEALIDWMRTREVEWRLPSLERLGLRAEVEL